MLVHKRSGCMCMDKGSLESCCWSQRSRGFVCLPEWLCGPGAVEHLTRVISSMRSSEQKLRPISAAAAVHSDSHTGLLVMRQAFSFKRENSTRCLEYIASALSTVVTALTPLWAPWLPQGVAAAPLGKRRRGGVVAGFYSPAEWQLLWPQEAVQQTPTDGTSMGRQIVDVNAHADLPPLLLTTTRAKTNT